MAMNHMLICTTLEAKAALLPYNLDPSSYTANVV